MAKDFMSLSQSYVEGVLKGKGAGTVKGETLLRLRSLIVSFTGNDYRIGNLGVETIIKKVKKELGIDVPKQKIYDDLQCYRKVYLYFNGTEEEKKQVKKMLEKKHTSTNFLRCLLNDGFVAWDTELLLPAKWEKQSETPAKTTTETIPVASTAPSLNGVVTFLQEMSSLFLGKKDEVCAISDQIFLLQGELEKTRDDLRREKTLREQTEKELVDLKDLQAFSDEIIKDLEGKICLMKKKLEEASEKGIIEKIRQLVLVPAQQEIAHETICAPSPSAPQKSEAPAEEFELPKNFEIYNLRAKYSRHFMESFELLGSAEKALVAKALEQLSKHGAKYRALGTVKLQSARTLSPKGCQKSRAGISLRFCWKSDGPFLELLELGTRENFS